MKLFGVLAGATCLLVVVGFSTGAFDLDRSKATDIYATNTVAKENKDCCGGCCSEDAVAAKKDCCGGCSQAETAEKSSCCQENANSAVSTKKDCDGGCSEGKSCCQDNANSAISTKKDCNGGCSEGKTCCQDKTSAVSTKKDCDGGCSEGKSCCLDKDLSRASMIAAASTDSNSTSNVAGAISVPASEGLATQEEENDALGKLPWPMWGGTIERNMVSPLQNVGLEFDLQKGENVNWVANLGSQTYGNAIVAAGKVFVGCNNAAEYRPKHKGDRGVLLCFDEETGEFQWQLTREKLTIGRVSDWPLQGICSTPAVETSEEFGSRLWVVTNRGELMCLDVDGMADGNDGPYDKEVDAEAEDADIIWNLDMIEDLGVFPHNLATSSPVIYEDMVYLLTSNGVDEAHLELPSPRAPCFLAVNKNTGEVVWEANQPFDKVLHGQWASPSIGIVNGKAQVYFPGGDGWLYALDAKTGEEIWKFDMNPKESLWELGGRGTRNAVIATAVFKDNSLVVAVGQDPEHGEGVGHLWRIDATKTGDISPELGEIGKPGTPNPNSGMIWHYGGSDVDGTVTGKKDRSIFRRTMSTVSIHDGLVYAADLSGFVHCVDFETGARYWEYDLFSGVWGSTMVADGKVFLGTEEGVLYVFEASKAKPTVIKQFETMNNSSIYSTPTFANGKMFLTDRTRLYSIEIDGKKDK